MTSWLPWPRRTRTSASSSTTARTAGGWTGPWKHNIAVCSTDCLNVEAIIEAFHKERFLVRFGVGQNLFIYKQSMRLPARDWGRAVTDWYDEVTLFSNKKV